MHITFTIRHKMHYPCAVRRMTLCRPRGVAQFQEMERQRHVQSVKSRSRMSISLFCIAKNTRRGLRSKKSVPTAGPCFPMLYYLLSTWKGNTPTQRAVWFASLYILHKLSRGSFTDHSDKTIFESTLLPEWMALDCSSEATDRWTIGIATNSLIIISDRVGAVIIGSPEMCLAGLAP